MTTLGGILGVLLFSRGSDARVARTELKGLMNTIEFEALREKKPTRLPILIRTSDTVHIQGDPSPIFKLNDSGRLIWDACDGHHSLEDICRQLHTSFSIPLHQARNDAFEFLMVLHTKHLIRL